MKILRVTIYLSFLLLACWLFYMQAMRFDYYKRLSIKNTIRLIPIDAPRGRIYDRNGQPLATNRLSFDLALVPQEVKGLKAAIASLSGISKIPEKRLLRNYKKNYVVPFVPVKIAANLNREEAFRIEEQLSAVPGAVIEANSRRFYPNNEVASHVIGYVSRIEKKEFKRLKDYGYKIQDLVGKSGIEKLYDAYLKGAPGGIQIEVDARSREVRRLGFKEPKRGKDIRLTIDLGLQNFIDMLFKGKKGACVVMDIRKGSILALLSSPEFDPNAFTTGTSKERLRLLRDAARPMINRAISYAYPPGSTFKVVEAAAGIASNVINEGTTYYCDGVFKLGKRKFKCWRESGHGSQNVIEALNHSCNVFFYNLGNELGVERLRRYGAIFGLGSVTGIDLPNEARGLLPGAAWKRLALKRPWYAGDTINYSIGQGYLLVTPVQMLKVSAAIGNEGYCPVPYLVDEIDNKPVSRKSPSIIRLREDAFKIVKEGMFKVVNDPTGTGQNAKARGIEIAGKTGTAQPGTRGRTHAWFVGYAPAKNPAVSFVIFIEHGGQGGRDPARMARLTAIYMKENGFFK